MLLSVSRLSLPLSDRVTVVVAVVVFKLHLERQRVTGGHLIDINNNVNTSSIKTIANNVSFSSLAFRCCVVCVSQLSLPLSDRVPGCSCCCCGVGGKDVMATKMLIENVLMLHHSPPCPC